MNNKINDPFSNLFEQATQITKAHAYDIVSKQVGELQEENKRLKEKVDILREALAEIHYRCNNNVEYDIAQIALTALNKIE